VATEILHLPIATRYSCTALKDTSGNIISIRETRDWLLPMSFPTCSADIPASLRRLARVRAGIFRSSGCSLTAQSPGVVVLNGTDPS